MASRDLKSIYGMILIMPPLCSWVFVVQATESLYSPRYIALLEILEQTPSKPLLIFALLSGFGLAVLVIMVITKCLDTEFRGAPY